MSKIKAFLHPTMLRTERSFRRLMKDLPGGVGYGVAIILIEILSAEEEQKFPISDVDLLADEIGISIPILNTIITKYNIFDVNDDYIECPMLYIWLQPYIDKIEQNRKAGKISAKKRKEKATQQELLLSQKLSEIDSTEHMFNACSTNKTKQNKTKQKKNTTTIQMKSKNSSFFEKWLEEKSKNARNKTAYKTTLVKKYKNHDSSVTNEFNEWLKNQDEYKMKDKLIEFRDKKIILDNSKEYKICGVEIQEYKLHVYLDNIYNNSYQVIFQEISEIEKRIIS